MVNYNDGKWHGWNGGECPVHPETVVECVCVEGGIPTTRAEGEAEEWVWSDDECPIIAFRVVKEHREPREWWIVPGSNVALCCAGRLTPRPHPDAVLVREVLDGNACASAS